ncbi:MAG: CinA family nicotinamide mononucleotide deamidase-related protein [Acidimicrobiia bacterium]|nr:CinA family nicotinamide mononucleotide deamidase-related protein [Acidimicrobiia bacterium]MYI19420.1 CinA family nicotinamide mononucleotide deamidase-related protein [Acidimicrobiia bacterium]
MRCEVVAVGTELLLGQVVDTNSSWIGQHLAGLGIDSYYQTKVGDNLDRICAVLRTAVARNDFVVVCGGLGPTPDDITREALAAVMGVELRRDPELVERISAKFWRRGRSMPANNLQQADVPDGAEVIPVFPGTAPGLVCPVGDTVVYAVPGVPWEMQTMMTEWIAGDMRRRAGVSGVIQSRTLRTWGESEGGLAERLGGVIDRLDASGRVTLAFLASGIEGLKVRLTAKADTAAEAAAMLDAEEAAVRAAIDAHLVFGTDEETMETAVLELCRRAGLTLATAESLTGGMIATRLSAAPGASDVFRGSLVTYAAETKRDLLGVPAGPVVSEAAVRAMAAGACEQLGADCSLAVTGVAGPAPADGEEPGMVWMATSVDGEVVARRHHFPFDRERTRQFTTIGVLNELRLRLLAREAATR